AAVELIRLAKPGISIWAAFYARMGALSIDLASSPQAGEKATPLWDCRGLANAAIKATKLLGWGAIGRSQRYAGDHVSFGSENSGTRGAENVPFDRFSSKDTSEQRASETKSH
ncbi:MAG: hypothetical protein AAGG44_20540, partial [Planctomycetota bacterium]